MVLEVFQRAGRGECVYRYEMFLSFLHQIYLCLVLVWSWLKKARLASWFFEWRTLMAMIRSRHITSSLDVFHSSLNIELTPLDSSRLVTSMTFVPWNREE